MGRVTLLAIMLAVAAWAAGGLSGQETAPDRKVGDDGLMSILVRSEARGPTPAAAEAHASEPRVASAGIDPPAPDEPEALRDALVERSLKLFAEVDEGWQRYLALPPEVFADGLHSPHERLQLCAARYASVAADERYLALAEKAEFQSAHTALLRYVAKLRGGETALRLPPPPNSW